MADSNPSRVGLDVNGGADVNALMLSLFGGEVITAFQKNTMLMDKHQSKTLAKGKEFRFPAIWKATGGYHTPGTEITGDTIPHTEIIVSPDDKLVSSVFIADIDELLNHYDVRQPYTTELGRFLAEHYDANILRTLLLSARGPALFAGDQGGGALENAGFDTDANAIIDGISQAKEVMDVKDVPIHSQPVHAMLAPAQWYRVARSDKNLNRDTNGGGASIRSMTLTTIDDIAVHKSNIAAGVFGADDSANADIPAKYRAKFGTTKGVVWTPMAACSALVQRPSFQIVDQPEKQGTLLLSRMMVGTDPLRTKCAVELRTAAVPV